MAETVDYKIKNKAFLQDIERQRLNKPSSLAIDLRNKVAGECQPYLFGGITHHLDDRGYLLVKRLIERFEGRYTIGVYELLFKAIKTLAKAPSLPPISTIKTILHRGNDTVQLLSLDKQLQRESLRIVYTTTIEIALDDILYHATTLDISSVAARVVMKRAFTLKKGDIVQVSFPELSSDTDPDLLMSNPHKIVKIDHDDLRTHLILNRVETNTSPAKIWWEEWLSNYKSLAHFDVDHELLNITHDFYLRLYHQNTKKPLFWLGPLEQANPVKVINLSRQAMQVVASLYDSKDSIDLSLLPIQQLLSHPESDYLVFISKNDAISNSVVIACDQIEQVSLALSQADRQVLLLKSHRVSIDDQMLIRTFKLDKTHSQRLNRRLADISHLVTITDITQSCRHCPVNSDSNNVLLPPFSDQQTSLGQLPKPTALHHHIQRKDHRFLIKTDISLYLMDEHLSVSTSDVSETGLSLDLSGHFPVPEGTLVRINFIRWQSKTKKVKLNDVPFIVRRMQYWEGVTSLGLERNVMTCGKKLNQFFVTTIADNRDQLATDRQDRFVIQESKILGITATQTMTNIPFFLGLNDDKKRAIQSVASTEHNQAQGLPSLWPALSGLAAEMSEWLKVTLDNMYPITDFGLYCYLDNTQQWQLTTDHHFVTAKQKALFVHRALLAEHYHFFHCDLTAIKSSLLEREADLDRNLSRLRHHNPHNVKQIKEVIQSLFAVGDLSDITPIIEAAYSAKPSV